MKVSDIMTQDVLAVTAEHSLADAAKILIENKFDGLPVVNSDNIVVGVITDSDLITGESNIHIPTLVMFLEKFDLHGKDKKYSHKSLDLIRSLKVGDIMNTTPPKIDRDATLGETMKVLSGMHGISPLPVVDISGKIKGVVTR